MKWEPHYDEMTEVFTMAHDQEVLPMARDQDNNEQSPGNFQSYWTLHHVMGHPWGQLWCQVWNHPQNCHGCQNGVFADALLSTKQQAILVMSQCNVMPSSALWCLALNGVSTDALLSTKQQAILVMSQQNLMPSSALWCLALKSWDEPSSKPSVMLSWQ
jgi:hypothetical protein